MINRRIDLRWLCVCALCLWSPACLRQEMPGNPPPDMLPFGKLLEPVLDSQALDPKQGQNVTGPFRIRGWALSENGIQRVILYEDRTFLADAKLGLSSPEAKKEQGPFPGSATAGFQFDVDPSMFTSNKHELAVQAVSKTGAVRELASWWVIIGTPYGKMDEPVKGQQISAPFAIRGWAISEQGVDQVLIYVDGKFFANSRLGSERPDVHAAFPLARDGLTSGWRFEANPGMFPAGVHEIAAHVRSKGGAVKEIGKVTVNIRN